MKKSKKVWLVFFLVMSACIGLWVLSNPKRFQSLFSTHQGFSSPDSGLTATANLQSHGTQGTSPASEEQIKALVAHIGERGKGFEPPRSIYIRLQDIPPLEERYPNAHKLVEIGSPAIEPLLNALVTDPITDNDSMNAKLIALNLISDKATLDKLLNEMSVGCPPEKLEKIERARTLIRNLYPHP